MGFVSGTFPPWLKKKAPKYKVLSEMSALFSQLSLNTVCKSARCPNQGDCFQQKTATFLIMGDICTRNCGFCNIITGNVSPPDLNEPENVARAIQILGLKHAVVTSVSRDDLSDGGASFFADTIVAIKELNPQTSIEVLIPDFNGSYASIKEVVHTGPDVIGHNLETVSRLYHLVRPDADYNRSLKLLSTVKMINNQTVTKSGLMLGLGERKEEVIKAMEDLYEVNTNLLTIGQYLPPSPKHIFPDRFVEPDEFIEFRDLAYNMGFIAVSSGPFVRSSYNALEMFSRVIR